jgi:autophagy-related protein 11
MMQTEIDNLRSSIPEANAREASERERADKLANDLRDMRAQLDSQLAACRILEPRQAELSSDVESLRRELATASAKVSKGEEAEGRLIQELANVRAELEDAKAGATRNSVKLARLEKKHAEALRDLEDTKMQSEDLEAQVRVVLAEGADIKLALAEVGHEKERQLRVQANEHDRILRDHIAEADGDRAVLEHKCHVLEAANEDAGQRLKGLQSKYDVCCSDAVGLKEELQRMERELREVRHVERLLRDDLKAGRASQSDFEQKLGASNHLIAQILEVAIAFRNTHLKAFSTTQAMVAHPNSGIRQSNLLGSPLASDMRHSLVGLQDEPSPIDPTDIHSALDALRSFDHDQFLESIAKTGAVIRKWQRQCKDYRERAKGKISFRNFAKGDLALFLPTRNSVSKPWAAFNGTCLLSPCLSQVLTHSFSIFSTLLLARYRQSSRATSLQRMDSGKDNFNNGTGSKS